MNERISRMLRAWALIGFHVALGLAVANAGPQLAYPVPTQHPRHWVELAEGVPFAVPSGRVLTVTTIGVPTSQGGANPSATLLVDGQKEAHVDDLEYGLSMQQLGSGVIALPGQVVSVSGFAFNTPKAGRAWGFLSRKGKEPDPWRVPPPEEWVTLTEQAPFTVPVGKVFVAVSGGNIPIHSFAVKVNGTQVLGSAPPWAPQPEVTPLELPIGLRALAGDVVSVEATYGGGSAARLRGFLVDG